MHIESKACRTGFSLIELVIVVAIMAVIAAIAMPRFADAASGRSLQSAKNIILDDLQRVKMRARATKTQHVIQFLPSSEMYIVAEGSTIRTDSIVLARDLSNSPYGVQIYRTNRSGDNTAIITPFGDLSPSVRVQITDGTNSINVDLEGIPDTGESPIVEVTEKEVQDLGLVGGLLDALDL